MRHAIGIGNGNWRAGDLRQYVQEMTKTTSDREQALDEIKRTMGSEEFENWYRDVYELRRAGNQAEYEIRIFKKLEEIKVRPDSLFSEVILLEHRRDQIMKSFKQSDNQDQLTLELAEIETALNGYHGNLDDIAGARLCARYGSSL